ncbi:hypothetical protein JOQ06_023954 [Pogonophryne albipinna]|uniref:Uncharacterized protein n=1 Tax=Pogonophryne albipinna TaxID=1090488 RepID=A0AAD6BM93_9TELE|nr:hypothetical protein JOQ06_023954 [Pogonophryne albipinna]
MVLRKLWKTLRKFISSFHVTTFGFEQVRVEGHCMPPHLSRFRGYLSIGETQTYHLLPLAHRPLQVEEKGGWCINVSHGSKTGYDQSSLGLLLKKTVELLLF